MTTSAKSMPYSAVKNVRTIVLRRWRNDGSNTRGMNNDKSKIQCS